MLFRIVFTTLFFVSSAFVFSLAWQTELHKISLAHFAYAEEEEDEDEYEDEEDDEEEDEDKEDGPSTQKIQVVKQVIEYKPVQETTVVTEKAYEIDTDGDKLVDALDPDPLIRPT